MYQIAPSEPILNPSIDVFGSMGTSEAAPSVVMWPMYPLRTTINGAPPPLVLGSSSLYQSAPSAPLAIYRAGRGTVNSRT